MEKDEFVALRDNLRLSAIKDADKIVVVKDGQIEAAGKHEELRKDCPLYEAMWQAHIGAKDGDVA